MNNLIEMPSEMTMDSLEFLREIINPSRLNLGEPEVQNSKFVARVEDELDDLPAVKIIHRFGNEVRSYDLTMKQMMLVGMRESKAVRRAVMAKLESMSEPKAPQVPQTYAAALLEAGRLAMELEQSQAQLAIAAPKADVFDRVIERDTLLNATQVAQQIGMSAIKMNRKLDELGGVYNKCVKRGRAFCHDWVLSGYGEMKITEMGYPQPLFTTKGSLRVAEIFTSEGVV